MGIDDRRPAIPDWLDRLKCPRILALMLTDHGEFAAGLPALRQLRAAFPQSHVTLVCRSMNIKAAEACGLANKLRACDAAGADADLEGFRAAVPGCFDIAIDLQVGEDTRPLLQHIEAELRCGIGSHARFRFLDVALADAPETDEVPVPEAGAIVLDPGAFSSRMPVQTRFFHQTDFSVTNAHLIYGPYCRLPLGKLRASFDFELSAPAYCRSRRVEIALEAVRESGEVIALQRVLELRNGDTTRLELDFSNDDRTTRFEFRVFVGGRPRRSRLKFYGAVIERPSEGDATLRRVHERLSALVRLVVARVQQLVSVGGDESPDIWDGQTWPLSLYPRVRPYTDLVIRPPSLVDPPRFSVVVIDGGDDSGAREATLTSLAAQTRAAEEILVVSNSPSGPYHGEGAVPFCPRGPDRSNAAVINEFSLRATGTHLIVIEAGVTLSTAAFAWLAATIERSPAAVIYSDGEAVFDDAAGHQKREPLFQPAFDLELLLQRNYIGATFWATDLRIYRELGGMTEESAIDPWHDLLLRIAARLGRGAFVHLPLVLAAAPVRSGQSAVLNRTAGTVQRHLEAVGAPASVVPHQDAHGRALPDAVTVLWRGDPGRRIAVIVPTRDGVDMVFALISSLRRHAADWRRVEIVVAANGIRDGRARMGFREIEESFANTRVIDRPVAFNWCEMNNAAAAAVAGDGILLFLNDDMICLTPDWDARLAGQLGRPEIGLVGARLLYPDRSVQHAGIAINEDGLTAHEGSGEPADSGLYRDRTLLVHEAAVLTGAFLACRQSVFAELGGFDAQRYAITSGDADFCLRVAATGRSVLYDPLLTWVHYESVSRGRDPDDAQKQVRADLEHEAWRAGFDKLDLLDLSGNPHLRRSSRPYELFRRPDREEIELWLAAQLRRRARWQQLSESAAARASLLPGFRLPS